MKQKRILVGLGVIVALLIFFFTILFFIGRYSGGKSGRFAFGDKIAIVEVKGVITQSSGVIEELQQYLEDEGVKAIILRVDSPGGGRPIARDLPRDHEDQVKEKSGHLHGVCGGVWGLLHRLRL